MPKTPIRCPDIEVPTPPSPTSHTGFHTTPPSPAMFSEPSYFSLEVHLSCSGGSQPLPPESPPNLSKPGEAPTDISMAPKAYKAETGVYR